MRKEFLRIVAEVFLEDAKDDLRKYCFVFPNKRSSLFFQRYIGETIDRPVFSPHMTTINELFASLSEQKVADKLHLLFRLYQTYSHVVSSYRQSFDDFVYWGDMLLNDFDDVDKYRVPAKDLFTNISDLKEISDNFDYLSEEQCRAIESFWGTVVDRNTGTESQFVDLWKYLYDIYASFRRTLGEEGLGYEGMIYRNVADRIFAGDTETIDAALGRYGKIVFIGMNALNECEKQLFDYLKQQGKGDFYWDYYGSVIRDHDNKSSMFMKDNVVRYPSALVLPKEGGLPDRPPHVEAVALSSSIGQAKYVSEILQKILAESDSRDLFSTAIVLPDENLLFPVLNSIPEEIRKVNVTMGYTLSQSNVSAFISLVYALVSRKKEKDGVTSYYFRNVLDLFAHPYLKKGMDGKVLQKYREDIVRSNRVYVPADFFAEEEDPDGFLGTLFRKDNVPLPDYLRQILEKFSVCTDKVENEFFLGYYRCINQLDLIDLEIKDSTYFSLLRQIASGISIPFRGEPLAGLQIMGPLETRALDFENIIMLSINEGTFPAVNAARTMIPYHLRKGFRLPTYEYQDAISAYHFYRSIARARHVYLLYDSRTEGLTTGEESRYIKQLEYHHGLKIDRKTVVKSLEPQSAEPKGIGKKPFLEKMKSVSYSPSAIEAYYTCSMKFYYQYVMGLREEEELMEEVDSALFGQLYHKAMELLYQDFQGKEVTDLMLQEKVRKDLDAVIAKSFSIILKTEEISGRNLIIEAMIREYVLATVRMDAGPSPYAPFRYLSGEQKCRTDFRYDGVETVKIKGIIDRIDQVNGHYRLLDYKTGSPHDAFDGDMEKLFSAQTYADSKNVFQLFFYVVILKSLGIVKETEGTFLSLYYTRKLFEKGSSQFVVTGELYEAFVSRLKTLFREEILNPDRSFEMCEDVRNCSYCPFKVICNR